MLTSDYIKTIQLTEEEQNCLAHTYVGLGILYNKLYDKVCFDGTALSTAIGLIEVLKVATLDLLKNRRERQ